MYGSEKVKIARDILTYLFHDRFKKIDEQEN